MNFHTTSSTQHCTSDECVYSHSHTAEWCGYEQFRRCGCAYCYPGNPRVPTTDEILGAYIGAARTAGEATVVNRTMAFHRWLEQEKAAAKRRALIDFADANRFMADWVMFRRDDGSGVSVSDLLRETAANYLQDLEED